MKKNVCDLHRIDYKIISSRTKEIQVERDRLKPHELVPRNPSDTVYTYRSQPLYAVGPFIDNYILVQGEISLQT